KKVIEIKNGLKTLLKENLLAKHLENGPYFQTFTTSERKWLVGNLNTSTKYFVRVLASTKVGHGTYSESEGFFTNGRPAEKAIAKTSSTLTFSLKIPSKTFVYFYVVALKLKDGKEPASSDSYENNELVTYGEAENSTNPKPYIAAVVASSVVDGNMFVLGDGRNTSNSTSRKRRSPTSDYFNGPLEPGTSYSVFQRIIINEMGEYYSTAWSPPSKTSENTDQVPGDVSDTDDTDGFEKYLVAIIIASTILLVILCVIAYCIYQSRRLKSNTDDVHHLPSSQHDDIGNYEQVHNEESMYIALKSPGEVNDDHCYGHLNPDVQNVHVDQEETGI
ncbi:Receptor-type tyrosine- phosphatase delta, partial [Paramuricea clavata]